MATPLSILVQNCISRTGVPAQSTLFKQFQAISGYCNHFSGKISYSSFLVLEIEFFLNIFALMSFNVFQVDFDVIL